MEGRAPDIAGRPQFLGRGWQGAIPRQTERPSSRLAACAPIVLLPAAPLGAESLTTGPLGQGRTFSSVLGTAAPVPSLGKSPAQRVARLE